MKKHLAKIVGGLFAIALVLTGCATVSSVKNNSKDIIYYGGSAVTVGDYTYFANAYTPYEDKAEFDYKGNAKISYLARINNADLNVSDGKDFSPSKVEKVNDKVTGYQNQEMFVLGDYIYFTSMNVNQYKDLTHDYSLVTFYRSNLNGDGLKEIYTTEYFNNGEFVPVGDAEHGYYWLCYTGAYDSSIEGTNYSGQIISISLGSKLGEPKVIAENVTSAVFANVNEDGNLDKVFYTTTESTEFRTKYAIYSIDYSGENKIEYNGNSKVINLIDKIEDNVFYTVKDTENSTVYDSYYRDVSDIQENELFTNGQKNFVNSGTLNNLRLVLQTNVHKKGVVYLTESGNLVYKNMKISSLAQTVVTSDRFNDILFVEDEWVYLSNDTGIYRISLMSDLEDQNSLEKIVSLTSIVSGQFGYDGKYVYFFGGLEDVEVEGQTEDSEGDSNKYMYRVNKSGGDYQLIGKTVNERKPKQED